MDIIDWPLCFVDLRAREIDGYEHLIDCAPKRLKRQRHLVKSDLRRGRPLAHTIPSIHAMPSEPIEATATCECPHFSVAGTCTIVKH